MEIPNPRRILAVSLADSAQHLSDVIRDLTGTHPTPSSALPEQPEATSHQEQQQQPLPPSTSSPASELTITTTNPSTSSHRDDQPTPTTPSHPHPHPTTTPQPALAPKTESESEPEPESEVASLAGTTHPLQLTTPYYIATVPVWLDLIPTAASSSSTSGAAEWASSFLAPEAREVLEVLGGVVVVFRLPSSQPPSSGWGGGEGGGGGADLASAAVAGLGLGQSAAGEVGSGEKEGESGRGADEGGEKERARELIASVGRVVREGLGGWEWDGVGLAVGVRVGGAGSTEVGDEDGEMDEWEDLCAEWGLEFVHVSRRGGGVGAAAGKDNERNEFGERTGMARVREALEANDWAGGGLGAGEEGEYGEVDAEGKDEEDDEAEFDPETLGFGFDREDFVGLKKAIWAGGGDGGEGPREQGEDKDDIGEDDVQALERMMVKLQAVRDASAGLPEDQRRRMAARAVGEVMKEL